MKKQDAMVATALAYEQGKAEGVAAGLRMASAEAERQAADESEEQVALLLKTIAAWCEAAAKEAEGKR